MADDPTGDATSPDASTSTPAPDAGSAAAAPARAPSDDSSSANMSSADTASADQSTTDQSTADQSTVNQSTAPSPSADTQSQPLQSIDPSIAAIAQITALAANSDIASYNWQNRGRAPAGYIKGMAVAYARAYCKLKAGDAAATEVAKADTSTPDKDAVSFYSDVFQAAGMDNSNDGVDTLRHVYVLLTGLGMRESSGVYCEGRDTSAANTGANTAEAGMFQMSFNAKSASPLMPQLFTQYAGLTDFADIFKEGVSCSNTKLQNFGSGDGAEFQRLTKACPAFAVEFAAVGLRNIRKHWGPINLKKAEVRAECDDLLTQVQNLVDQLQITAL